jgi:hypothetical protein
VPAGHELASHFLQLGSLAFGDGVPVQQVFSRAGAPADAFEQASDDYRKAAAYEFIKFLREMSSALDTTSKSVSMELAWEDNVPELMRRVGDGEIPPPQVAYDGPNAALIFPAGVLRREVIGLSFCGRDGKRVSFYLFGAPAQSLMANAAPGQVVPRVPRV